MVTPVRDQMDIGRRETGKRPSRTSRACRSVWRMRPAAQIAHSLADTHQLAAQVARCWLHCRFSLSMMLKGLHLPLKPGTAAERRRRSAGFHQMVLCEVGFVAFATTPRLESPANQTGYRRRRNSFVWQVPRRVPL